MTAAQIDFPTLIVTWICSILALLVILLRVFIKKLRHEALFLDDQWVVYSIIPLIIRLGVIHVVLVFGTNNLSDSDRATLTSEDISKRKIGSQLILVGRVTYAALYVSNLRADDATLQDFLESLTLIV